MNSIKIFVYKYSERLLKKHVYQSIEPFLYLKKNKNKKTT